MIYVDMGDESFAFLVDLNIARPKYRYTGYNTGPYI